MGVDVKPPLPSTSPKHYLAPVVARFARPAAGDLPAFDFVADFPSLDLAPGLLRSLGEAECGLRS